MALRWQEQNSIVRILEKINRVITVLHCTTSFTEVTKVISEPNSCTLQKSCSHYDDVIIGAIASQITSLTIVYSTVYSGADQSKHQSSAPLAFVWGIHRGPVNSPHKWPVTRKMFPFDDVIMRDHSDQELWTSYMWSVSLDRCFPAFSVRDTNFQKVTNRIALSLKSVQSSTIFRNVILKLLCGWCGDRKYLRHKKAG